MTWPTVEVGQRVVVNANPQWFTDGPMVAPFECTVHDCEPGACDCAPPAAIPGVVVAVHEGGAFDVQPDEGGVEWTWTVDQRDLLVGAILSVTVTP